MSGTRLDVELAGGKPRSEFDPVAFLNKIAPLLFLLTVMAVFAAINPNFLSWLNIFNVLRQVSIAGLVAIGMTFVILTAGIDLSVGSLLAFSGLVCAYVAKGGFENRFAVGATALQAENAVVFAVLAAVAIGLAGGLIQGLAITWLKVPPFVATLGGLTAFRGAGLLFSGGGPISGFSSNFTWWGQGKIDMVPVPVIIFVAFAILAHLVLTYTAYGRHTYAVGGNLQAAEMVGLNVRAITLSVYVISGFFAGLGGFLIAARLNSAEAVAGEGLELRVIAAVVIGGTSLFGGIGNIPGTVIGTLLIGFLLNGLVLLRVSPFIQMILVGVLVVAAVAFDQFAKSRRSA